MKNILLSTLFIFASAIVSNLYAECQVKNNEIIVAKKTSCDTITAGIKLAQPGQTVKVRYDDKAYEENIVIDKSIRVVRDNSQDANNGIIKKPIIKSLNKIIVDIKGKGITFDGFEVKNADDFVEILNQDDQDDGRVGVKIEPGSSDISISHNKFNYIGYKYLKNGQNIPIWCGEQAHAINAVSYDKDAQIKGVYIRSNEFTNLHQGKSEAVTLNGNLTGFEISDNRFWDIDNIAIDIAGFYGECPKTENGNSCQANNGKVFGNKVWNLSDGNPGQKKVYPTLAAIYIDGGRDVLVDRNEVHHFGVGLDFGSEKGGTTEKVILSNNLVYLNKSAGIWIGNDGFAEGINDCLILNNTIANNNTEKPYEGAIRFTQQPISPAQQGKKNIVIANNLIFSNTEYPLLTNLQNKNAEESLTFFNNFFFSKKETEFSNHEPITFGQFLAKYYDAAGKFRKIEVEANYDLLKDSYAIDKGSGDYLNRMCEDLSKCFDLRGKPRVSNNKIDVGAVEFQFSK